MNQPRKREKEQPSNFVLVSLSLQACEKMSHSDHPCDVERGSYYNYIIILPPLNLQVSTHSVAIDFSPVSVCVLRMCALRKPRISSRHANQNQTDVFCQSISNTSWQRHSFILEKGAGTHATHLHLKRHARKQPVSASTQKRRFQIF